MQSSNLRGILSMIVAVAAFSVMDVTMKRLVETYSPMQVTFMRAIASLPFLLLATGLWGRWRDIVPQRIGLHLLRGCIGVAMLWLFVYAVRFLSLADAYTIYMSAPLLITALAVPFLGERVGWRRWAAVIVGLIGVIVVLKPSGTGIITIGGLAALASAVLYAISAITIRILSRTDTGAAIIFWVLLFMALFSGFFALFDWTPLQREHGWLILGVGLSGAIGQHFITYAFRQASPAVVAPIEYTALLWGMTFDWLLWLTLPGSRMLIGAGIIVGSGLYVIYRERVGK
ncbi:MAG TPA: DMT family transporter [Povalibacter sp.]|uniref:DMT family transporter n=1 Tax=Povalibacter sp. TaxID=1962978 RepID=UPI002D033F65|nr:DMT family transporter [Povalibacter sp.]HMN45811.1 DMT family transporter [Povalibacter sp.]